MKKTGTSFVHYKHFLANKSKKVQQKQRKDIVQYSMYRRSPLTAGFHSTHQWVYCGMPPRGYLAGTQSHDS
jgi:hypothetical protein